jgi:hypothetical protein
VTVQIAFLFEPRDLWVGAFWTASADDTARVLTVYLTLFPCLPIRLRFIQPKAVV